jgi:hypothetical protein
MKKSAHAKKGFIEIIIIFIIALSFAIAAITTLFWSRVPLTVSQLKRFQAINYVEAALYETFNRFRSSTSPFDEWDANEWALWEETEGVSGFVPTDPTIEIDGITVTISVEVNDMGTPADLTDDRNEVLATLDQGQIVL